MHDKWFTTEDRAAKYMDASIAIDTLKERVNGRVFSKDEISILEKSSFAKRMGVKGLNVVGELIRKFEDFLNNPIMHKYIMLDCREASSLLDELDEAAISKDIENTLVGDSYDAH